MTTTPTARCECGGTQPHQPARYIAPGVDGIDSTTRTCPGVVSEARGSLGGMTTANDDDVATVAPGPDPVRLMTLAQAAIILDSTPWNAYQVSVAGGFGPVFFVPHGEVDGIPRGTYYVAQAEVSRVAREALAEVQR